MDKRFEALLIEAERLRGDERRYARNAKRVEDQGKAWGLLAGDTEESLAYRAEIAAFCLEKYHGETIGSVFHLPRVQKMEIINCGEEAAGVLKLKAIEAHNAFTECVPVITTLEPEIKQAVDKIIKGDPREYHTQTILERLERCNQCGAVSATFGWYQGGYGYSVDGGSFTEVFDKNGHNIERHNCDPANQ
ncbi:MAG: hypothetical protein HYT03_00715 [Candidatus Harrisonbacteria bacterium]|nr:hypothetical protein [Candidatus Harrisonbacteria bacterium]